MHPADVVDTPAQAAALDRPPLLVLRPLETFLDRNGLGSGELVARRIGDGHSNVTFLVERAGLRAVLRRPPRPPLPPSAHDMLREARLLRALAPAGVRVPRVLAVCDDADVLGVPFYVMAEATGVVVTDALPAVLDVHDERRRIGLELVDALCELHAVDWRAAGLAGFGRPEGYLERQVRRFAGLWEHNRTRELPQVAELAEWLERHRPQSGPACIVHGDYRLGNVLVSATAPARVTAVLDWELATLGDPLADVGYLVATWSDAASPGGVLELSPVTRRPGFPSRDELVACYERASGRTVGALAWYEALALWKAAVFCEAIYGRHLRGELRNAWTATLEAGVPALLDAAGRAASRPG